MTKISTKESQRAKYIKAEPSLAYVGMEEQLIRIKQIHLIKEHLPGSFSALSLLAWKQYLFASTFLSIGSRFSCSVSVSRPSTVTDLIQILFFSFEYVLLDSTIESQYGVIGPSFLSYRYAPFSFLFVFLVDVRLVGEGMVRSFYSLRR